MLLRLSVLIVACSFGCSEQEATRSPRLCCHDTAEDAGAESPSTRVDGGDSDAGGSDTGGSDTGGSETGGSDTGASDAGADCMRVVAEHRGASSLTLSVAWAPDADYALVGAVDELRLLRVDLASGTLVPVASYLAQRGRLDVAWSPHGRYALSADKDVRLLEVSYDPPSISEVARLDQRVGAVFYVAWSPDGTHAVATGMDSHVRLLAVDGGGASIRQVADFEGHTGRVFMANWSEQGESLLTAGEDGTARWLAFDRDQETLAELGRFSAAEQITEVGWYPGGGLALIGLWDGGNDLDLVSLDEMTGEFTLRSTVDHHLSGTRAIAWTPDGRHVLAAGHDHNPALWATSTDLHSLQLVQRLPHDGTGVHELSWSPQGDHFLIAASQLDLVTLVDASACLEQRY